MKEQWTICVTVSLPEWIQSTSIWDTAENQAKHCTRKIILLHGIFEHEYIFLCVSGNVGCRGIYSDQVSWDGKIYLVVGKWMI